MNITINFNEKDLTTEKVDRLEQIIVQSINAQAVVNDNLQLIVNKMEELKNANSFEQQSDQSQSDQRVEYDANET